MCKNYFTRIQIVPDIDLAIVKNELKIHENLTQKETGCLIFNVTQGASNINKFNTYEEFINQQAFDSHQSRIKNLMIMKKIYWNILIYQA